VVQAPGAAVAQAPARVVQAPEPAAAQTPARARRGGVGTPNYWALP
jgi:hypothetical protein